ncbi:MAG: hypothetical protein WDA60_15715 [Acidimicrobiia bacterium]
MAAVVVGSTTAGAAKGPPSAHDSRFDFHSSGLEVTREWKLVGGKQPRLTATLTVENTAPSAITADILEPLPTTSAKDVAFGKHSKPSAKADGLARYRVTIAPSASKAFTYEADLTRSPTRPDDRLAEVLTELEGAFAGKTATPDDLNDAQYAQYYAGTAQVASETTTPGLNLSNPQLGATQEIKLGYTFPAVGCSTPARGCAVFLSVGAAKQPAEITPPSNALSVAWTEDYTNRGQLTCPDGSGILPVSVEFRDTVEPVAAQMTWSGWNVSELALHRQSTIRTGAKGRCPSTFVDRVLEGRLHAQGT